VIWFCDTDAVAALVETDADALARLRATIGLTTLMAEDHVHHTSGFAASAEVAARSPLRDWPKRRELLELHLGKERVAHGVYPVVPGVLGGVDDSNLRRVLDAAERAGVEVWGHIGLWSYAGEVFPEFSMRDVWGRQPDAAYHRWGTGFCPSKRAINEWVADGLRDVTSRYRLAGFMADHARYPAPASVWSFFGCACADCAAEGRRLGYDVDAIYAAVRDLPERLRRLSPDRLRRAADAIAAPVDWLTWLGGGKEIVAWVELRCRLLAERMAELRRAVVEAHAGAGAAATSSAARSAFVWGSDVFPPSVSIFGGHNYALWQRGADYLTGGSSHGGVVGWATAVTYFALEWGKYLCGLVPGLDAETALRLLYRLVGYDDLVGAAGMDAPLPNAGAVTGQLPLAFAPLERGDAPVVPIMAREMARLTAGAPETMALYPPIAAGRASDQLSALCRAAAESGVDGVLLSGLRPDDAEQLRTIGTNLGRLARE
jgi:hypothetical protein